MTGTAGWDLAFRIRLFGGLRLGLDDTGATFLLLTATLWLVGGVFALGYHARDPHRRSFLVWFLLAIAGNLGLVVAADAFSFYLFFVLMTFSAWGLVVHERTEEAYRAGRVYIVLAVLGDVAILAGLFSLAAAASGAPGFGPETEEAWRILADTGRWPGATGTAALLLVGFGVKAGLVPLHVWLPLAHPAAPTVASALLSGAMIKGGLLGWIRFLPAETAFPALAGVLLVLGAAAAFWGVIAGLLQDEAKTVLAYSSVSHVGFMTVAIGLMIRAPELAAAGAGAAVLYALHHGLAKGALFLTVGVVDRTPDWAGGRTRRPVLLLALLPALAVSGAPLTSGARAKGVLTAALERLGGAGYHVLEPLLLAAAFGTALLLARFLVVLDRRGHASEPPEPGDAARDGGSAEAPPLSLVLPWGLLVLVSLSAAFWLPLVNPVPGLEIPPLLDHLWTATIPVLLAVLVSWAAWRRRRLLGPLRSLHVPPGDLVVPVEAALRRVPFRGRGVPGAVSEFFQQWPQRLQSHVGRWLQVLADRDLELMRGTTLAVLLLVLVGLFVVGAFAWTVEPISSRACGTFSPQAEGTSGLACSRCPPLLGACMNVQEQPLHGWHGQERRGETSRRAGRTSPSGRKLVQKPSSLGAHRSRGLRRVGVVGVHEGPGRRETFAGLQEGLEPGEDHRPSAVELLVGSLPQLIVGDRQPARVAHRLDLPGHSRGALALHVVAPQRPNGLDQPAGAIHLEDLSLAQSDLAAPGGDLVFRARLPVRGDRRTEIVDGPELGVGDGLPEPFRGGFDVDLEHLHHGRPLQSGLEVAQRSGPALGVLADPPIVDQPDGDGVQEVQFLAAPPLRDHQARLLQHSQVLHHPEPGHVEAGLEGGQRLAVLVEERIQEAPPGRIRQRLEYIVRIHRG